MAGVNEKANCASPDQEEQVEAGDPPAASPATERNQGPQPFAPRGEAWSPEAIKIFLNMWTHPNIQAMKAARKRLRAIYRRISRLLHRKGVKKTWRECRDMMVALENLYWTFQESNQNREPPLFLYPFKEDLERVFPFSWASHEGSECGESDVESTDSDMSGAYGWNPIPAWTLPWHTAVQWVFIPYNGADVQNVQMMGNSTLQPPLVSPSTFACIPTQVPHWTLEPPQVIPSTFACLPTQVWTPQGPQPEIPRSPEPLITMENSFPREHMLAHMTRIQLQEIPFASPNLPWTMENHLNCQPQDNPSGGDVDQGKDTGQNVSDNRSQDTSSTEAPLMNLQNEEPLNNSPPNQMTHMSEAVQVLNSVPNEETVNLEDHTPQDI